MHTLLSAHRQMILATALVIAGVVIAGVTAGCGDGTRTVAADAGEVTGSPTDASSTTRTTPSTTPSTAPSTESSTEPARVAPTTTSPPEDRFFAWYSLEQGGQMHAVPYLVAASPDLDALYADNRFVVDVPFGMSPGAGRLQVWSESAGGPSHPASAVVWPIRCLGSAPDVDGDALLDSCDPYSADGPNADWDGDGILNPDDNCPTVANPDQDRFGDRHSGSACDSRQGVHAQTWLVPADVSLADWNDERAARGLEPIVMPEPGTTPPDDVVEWCLQVQGLGIDAPADAVRQAFLTAPPAYGFTVSELEAFAELSIRGRELGVEYDELERSDDIATGDDLAATMDRIREIGAELREIESAGRSFTVRVTSSDLACPR